MAQHSFASINGLLTAGSVRIGGVGAFWGQAALARELPAQPPLVAVPATLHFEGSLNSVVYAQLLIGYGVQQVRKRRPPPFIAWGGSSGGGKQLLGLQKFSIPDLALFWRGDTDEAEALTLATCFAAALADEFPRPEDELTRHFGKPMKALLPWLAKAAYLSADTTQSDLKS